MNKNILKAIGYGFAIIAVLFAVGGLFGFFDMTFLEGGGALAVGPAAGQVTAGESVSTETQKAANSEWLRPEIDTKITKIQPDMFPLDTVMREIGESTQSNSYEYKFYSVEGRGLTDSVKTTKAAVVGGAADLVHELIVNGIHIWNVHDNVLVQNINGEGGWPIQFHIVAKDIALTKLSCIVINGTGANLSDTLEIPADTQLTRLGNTKYEEDAQTDAYGIAPSDDFNYCQISMAMVKETLVAKMHNKEVDWDISDMKAQALWDYRSQLEFGGLYGALGYKLDPITQQKKYFQKGLIRQMTKKLNWSEADLDNPAFQKLGKDVFTGNNGSETKLLLAGSGYLEALASIPTVQKQIEAGKTEVIYGLKFKRIETMFGDFLVKHHTGLTQLGLTDSGLILDLAFVKKVQMLPLQTTKIDLQTSGVAKSNAYRIDEASCLVATNLDTHALVSKV